MSSNTQTVFFGGGANEQRNRYASEGLAATQLQAKVNLEETLHAPFALGSRKIDRKLDICQPAGYVGFQNLAVALPCEAGLGLADQHHVIH